MLVALYVVDDDSSWRCLDEVGKLASNDSSFSCVMHTEGICEIAAVTALPDTFAALGPGNPSAPSCELADEFSPRLDNVRQFSLERTLRRLPDKGWCWPEPRAQRSCEPRGRPAQIKV